jgi:rare lipoprotein A
VPKSTHDENAKTREEKTDKRTAGHAAKPTATPLMRRIKAAWYRVPQDSLAKRRAPDEYTAAHNSLPIGTRVRVTNPQNGRSVIVRITDRGIHDRRVKLDLCKEAAAELDVVEKGFAQLRMQVLPTDPNATPSESESIASADN